MSYLEQVKAALWGAEMAQEALSEDHVRLHMMQGTANLVFPSVPMTPQMKMVCLQNMQQQVKLNYTLEKAWNALEQAGLHAVLMKGASLAAFYPDPSRRSWGDVDLLVGVEQYHPACAVMRDTFPGALKFDEELDHYKHYNLIADGISIEVHRVSMGFQHPVDAARYAKMEAYAVEHACELAIGNCTLKVFEPTFNALFVMMHSWEHMMTQGANIRQFCDLALLLHHYAGQIDAARLKRYLKALHMTDVWQLYAYILVQYLGLPKNEMPLYTTRVAERAINLLKDLLAGRMVAPKEETKTYSNRVARKWHTMQGRLSNARRIGVYSPEYGRHMVAETLMHGALRFFAKDRHWE